jgi:hypothetical protein
MLTEKKILNEIRKHWDRIEKYGVKKIGLFGSYLKGKQRRKSDIDILVEFKRDKKTFDNYMELKFFLEDLFKCKIDLVVKQTLKPYLRPYILESVKYVSRI